MNPVVRALQKLSEMYAEGDAPQAVVLPARELRPMDDWDHFAASTIVN